jgi:dTDP-4-amino-4,6-dideoxygalactose transaminase
MIPFSPPKIYPEIIDEVIDTLKSGWITTGPKTKQLEKELEAYCQVPKVLCLNSATIGMELILRWLGVKEGDEVIVPAYTYCATANVVVHCGAKPVMVDVNEDFNIDIADVERKISRHTKAIIPVDIGGFPCDYRALNVLINQGKVRSLFEAENEIQEKLGRLLIMTDAAHSLGAHYGGNPLGSQADISVFSFHAVKNLTTAEGGAIAFNLPEEFDVSEIYSTLNRKSLHGQSKDALSKTTGSWRYDVLEAGYKANMTDILASLGLVEIKRYKNETLQRREKIFALYNAFFATQKWAHLPVFQTDERISSFHLYMLRIYKITEAQRDQIIEEINKGGVSVNVHFQPLPLLTFYKQLGYAMEDYPVAYDNYSREISLPVYYDLTDEQVKKVCVVVKNAVDRVIGNA